jgi:hypothetical protein
MMSRCILHLLGEKHDRHDLADHSLLKQKKSQLISESIKIDLYRFRTNTARRPANQHGKKMSSFRSRPRAVPPIYNNGYTT